MRLSIALALILSACTQTPASYPVYDGSRCGGGAEVTYYSDKTWAVTVRGDCDAPLEREKLE